MKLVPVILCGGSGTRLWPLSRTHEPKQLQRLFGEHSLLTHTAQRLNDPARYQPPIIICSQTYAEEVQNQLTSAGVPIGAILEEPVGRDTAAAAGIAALWALRSHGDDAVIALFPADHYISDLEAFHTAIADATDIARDNYICTIGIQPDRPETGYGYIQREAARLPGTEGYPVAEFKEKPNLDTAMGYLADGDYLWNAGIFVAPARLIMDELGAHAPDIASALKAATHACVISQNGAVTRVAYTSAAFNKIPKNSIDYAIMEHTRRAAVVPADLGWSDVGSWSSVRDLGAPDAEGNVMTGDVRLIDSRNCFAVSDTRIIAVVGLDDVTVVDTPDALLVCRTDRAQDVKQIHKALESEGHSAAIQHGSSSRSFESRCRAKARNWLFNHALPAWAEKGADKVNGGCYEALTHDLKPIPNLTRRVRVQARQAFVYARACDMGWTQGAEAMKAPLDYLFRHGQRDDGAFRHLVHPDGSVADNSVDLYDQAFVLMSMGWVYRITGERKHRDTAHRLLDFIEAKMSHPSGGFDESVPPRLPRRSNPHMHLFEAAITWMELHQDDRMAALADRILNLFKARLCVNGLLREFFHPDLSMVHDASRPEISQLEPGHLVEWVNLIRRHDVMTGERTGVTAVMEAFADSYGFAPRTDLLMDKVNEDGSPPETITSRLWPQTEYISLKLARRNARDTRKGLEMFERVYRRYLEIDGEVNGGWYDKIDGEGRVISTNVQTSTFYHLIGALAPLLGSAADSEISAVAQ